MARRALGCFLVVLAGCAGCGGKVAPELEAARDSGTSTVVDSSTPTVDSSTPLSDVMPTEPSVDSDVPDLPDLGVDLGPPIDAGPACAPISGTTPFAVNVAGTVVYDAPGYPDGTTGAILLFPKGRVAGAPVHLVRGLWPVTGFAIGSGVLDSSLSASPLDAFDPYCGNSIQSTLVGPSDGLVAKVTTNFDTTGSDALKLQTGHAKLCATSPFVTTPTAPSISSPWPLGTMTLVSDLPIDPATATSTKVIAAGATVPIKTTMSNGRLLVSAVTAFPPSAKTLELDLSGVRDLLGRAVPKPAPVSIWVPSGAVVARTFDVVPSYDAYATSGPSFTLTSDGSAVSFKTLSGYDYALLLGLGSEPGAKTIRFRHRFDCPTGTEAPKRILVIGSDGSIQPLAIGCSTTFIDEKVSLPGPQPSYLFIETSTAKPTPCSYPFGGPRFGSYVIDDLAFAP